MKGKNNLNGIFVDPVTQLKVEYTRGRKLIDGNSYLKPPYRYDINPNYDNLALQVAKDIRKRQQEYEKQNNIYGPRSLSNDWVAGNWLDEVYPYTRYANASSTERGYSLGEWGPRKITAGRQGIPVYTVEVRRIYTSEAYLSLFKPGISGEDKLNKDIKKEYASRIAELQAFADAIRDIFLESAPP